MAHPKRKLRNVPANLIRVECLRMNTVSTKFNKAREIHPGSPKLASQIQFAYRKPVQKCSNSKITKFISRNYRRIVETFIIWVPHAGLWTSAQENSSLATHKLVKQRNALSRPVSLQRRYDPQTQRPVFTPSRPNKGSRISRG